MTRRRVIVLSLASSLLLLLMLAAAPWLLAWRPAAHEAAPTACTGRAPAVLAGQALKVMSWNIGHLAGPTPTGERVEPEHLERNLRAVVATILEQEPDILLLQAVDDGDSRTGGTDQLAALQASLGNRYPCSSSAFYRQARWLPYPDMFASAGTRLAILSRYRLEHGERLQLPLASRAPSANSTRCSGSSCRFAVGARSRWAICYWTTAPMSRLNARAIRSSAGSVDGWRRAEHCCSGAISPAGDALRRRAMRQSPRSRI